ncbi:hypothetical protein QFC22_002435 [Naganishia vaughanmartiniae]|uniref:Uncharacterized protein n=1 Tax=Naganishia vaughanmartiniae TaxID=1424756 RepID=A0ACC2XEW9_9TREE|nr:hypothetical protein QFC22_002435 [Naganishia vaughanmartiniae]
MRVLFRQFHTESEIPHRGPILSVIADLIKSLSEAYTAPGTTRSHGKEKCIENYRDELLSLLSSGMESASPAQQMPALWGAVHLCQIPNFLTAEEVSFLVQKINDLLLQLDFEDIR